MTIRQPNGDDPAAIPERQSVPEIAVLLDRRRAYTVACALVEEIRRQVEYLSGDLDEARMGGGSSIDAQCTARALAHALDAIEEIGWPHAHYRAGFEHTMTEREAGGVGPWGS
jgi:hypothetical protein